MWSFASNSIFLSTVILIIAQFLKTRIDFLKATCLDMNVEKSSEVGSTINFDGAI